VGTKVFLSFFPLGVKEPEVKINHSPPSGTEVKNKWRCTATPPIYLHGLGRDKLTFYLTPFLTTAKILQ
jgi:hypothetical protein